MTSTQDFIALLNAQRSADPSSGLRELASIGDRMKKELDPDEDESERAWAVFSDVQSHLEGEQMLHAADPLAVAVERRRPDIVVRVGTDAAFACALEQATDHIGREYYKTQAGWIHAAGHLATTPERRARGGALRERADHDDGRAPRGR